jgi:TolA-binding protein
LLEYALPYLGHSYLRNRKLNEAKGVLGRALAKFPTGKMADQSRFDLASALEQLGERDEAAKLYELLAQDAGGKFADDAVMALGTRYFDDKRFEQALAAFADLERRFAVSPLVPTARLNRALSLYQLQRYDQARQILESLLAGEGKGAAEAWYWLGMTQSALGEFEQSAQTLLESFAKFPSSSLAPEMVYFAAQSLLQTRKYAGAIEKFQLLVAKFPKHDLADDALYFAGEAARLSGQHELAFRLANQPHDTECGSVVDCDEPERGSSQLFGRYGGA